MKLESTLKDRGGVLYTAPLMDVIMLLIIFFLFGSSFVLKSGIGVTLPKSGSVLPPAEDAHIVTLIPGRSGDFYFNDRRTTLEELPGVLEEAIKRSDDVILLSDETIDYGVVMEVSSIILRYGFNLSQATQQYTP